MDSISVGGTTPPEETCANVGDPDYMAKAAPEAQRYIEVIRRKLGREPAGARLAVKSNPHDFGHYLDVVCHYEEGNDDAVAYAFRCESEGPKTWDDTGAEGPPAPAPPLDLDRVMAAVEDDDGTGFCLKCNEEASGVEPDARNYTCEACGANQVFGAEEILLRMAA